ncbi:MAG: hypothetical protein JNL07_11170 [Rhodospirillales bacterium]|nr:hypothetical protein [Rhodospirillales bacterium]
MNDTSVLRTALIGFFAGAVAIVAFHQVGFLVLTQLGVIKATTYAMTATKPLGVPLIFSYMFWGGLWGVVGAFLVPRLPAGLTGAVGWILFAMIVPTLANWFIVAPLKGAALGNGFRAPGVYIAPLVYAFWGLGMWLLSEALGRVWGGPRAAR